MTSRPGRAVSLAVPVAAGAALTCLALTGQLSATTPGLPDAGSFVRQALPIARAVHDLAAALTVGLLVLAACVLPPSTVRSGDVVEGSRARAVRLAGFAGLAWVLAGAATLALTYADVAGVSMGRPGFTAQLGYFLRSFDLGRALCASLVLAACVCCGTFLATRQSTVGWLALLAIAALLPLALVGHAAGSDDHQAAVDSLALHLVGVCVWVGGLAALVLLSPSLTESLPVSARRYSTLAGWCFALVAVSGLVNAWVRLGSWSGLTTPYGTLVGLKASALVLLGVAGWRHRRWTLARLDCPGPGRRDFLRLAGLEVVLMAATMGVAVALARSAPPTAQGTSSGDQVAALLGFPAPEPLTVWRWLTAWNVEPAWGAVALLGLGWYLVAVASATRSGSGWPVRRTVAWVAGCLVLLWATSGAPGNYGRTQLSVQMVQHVMLMMVVPMLLVLGGPATLALRTTSGRTDGSRGPREWLVRILDSRALSLLAWPVVATTLFVATPVVLTIDPVFRVSLSTHAGHLLASSGLVITGYLFTWVLMGIDPVPRPVGRRGAFGMLLVALAGQVGLAFWVAMAAVRAPEWFESVTGRDLTALAADQRTGVVAFLALTVPLTLVMAIVVALGRRQPAADGQWTASRAVPVGDPDGPTVDPTRLERAPRRRASPVP